MPAPITPPKINVGADGPAAWLQAGLKYGINDSGPFQEFSYEGTRAEVEGMVNEFYVAGWTFTVTRMKNGISRIDAHAGWGSGGSTYAAETPEDIWELDPNEVEKPLLEADFPNGTIGQVSKHDKAVIQDALTRPADFLTSSPAFTDTPAAAQSLYLLMLAQVQAFPVEASTIRHTQLVSNRYTVKASYLNCNRIITSSSMSSVEAVPTDLLYAVPSAPSVTQYIETVGDLAYGWRKIRPAVTRLSRFKWRIVQNWQFGLWATKLYGATI